MATVKPTKITEAATDILQLKKQLEKARQKYKPERVKYLLVAEAPPDSLERFSTTTLFANTTIYF